MGGYGTLHNSCSIESSITILGFPEERDGVLYCKGHLIDFFSRKINRINRSTLSAEAVALSNCVDMSIWYKGVISEVFTGIYNRSLIADKAPYQIINPFKIHPLSGKINDIKYKD